MIDYEKMMESARKTGVDWRAIADFLTQMILNDPDTPESMKIGLRIMGEGEKLSEKIFEMTKRFAAPDANYEAAEANYAVRREALEYIHLVSAGVDAFMEVHTAFLNGL